MGGHGTVIDEAVRTHRAVEEIFARIDTLPLGDGRLGAAVDQVTDELVRHLDLERRHLYPAVREHLARGTSVADKEARELARIERLLTELRGLRPADREFDRKLDSLMQVVRSHIAGQEEHLFPRLRDSVSARRLVQLGEEARAAAQRTSRVRPA